MFKRKLCPKCKTGKYTYELDRRSPVCPYIGCHNGKKCPMYVKLEKPQKGGFWERITKKERQPATRSRIFIQKHPRTKRLAATWKRRTI